MSPPIPDPSKLFDLSCDLLTAARNCLVENGLPVPTKVYPSACDPDLFCCSNLVVKPGRIDIIEDPNSAGRNCLYRRQLHFDLWIERCVRVFDKNGDEIATGSCTVHPAGTLAGDAFTVLKDRWVILQCLVGHLRELGSGSAWCCQPVSIVQVEAVCEGQCAGTRFEIQLTI